MIIIQTFGAFVNPFWGNLLLIYEIASIYLCSENIVMRRRSVLLK